MFTGLIEATGELIDRQGSALTIRAPFAKELKEGDSVAINGICLTARHIRPDCFSADVSASTDQVTTSGQWQVGQPLNLERAMALGDRLGGHLVSGHVDGTGWLEQKEQLGDAWRLVFGLPPSLGRYLITKGSIAVDGISLTLNEVTEATFSVTIIPLTGKKTTLLLLKPGDRVNLEVDMLAKYVEKLGGFAKPEAATQGG